MNTPRTWIDRLIGRPKLWWFWLGLTAGIWAGWIYARWINPVGFS